MAYAKAIGCARVGVIETTFGEESVADLFGEQSVLSGGLIELMRAAFDVLVENGYSPEVAYIECISEVEYMASLVSRVGLDRLEEHISSTAYFGGTTRGRRIIDDRTRAKLKGMLKEIVDGEFLKEFKDYIASGAKIRGRGSNADLMKAARTNLGMGSEHEQ
jgi:ketol-acid reductoisomerase